MKQKFGVQSLLLYYEKKEEILCSPMTKAPTLNENPKSNVTTQNATKNFDYTTIAHRLRTVSWRNNSHPTGG